MNRDPTEQVLGYPVFNRPSAECVLSIATWIERGDRMRWLACLNPHSYAVALQDAAFAAALRDADWVVPDGVGIVLASRVLGGRIRERVTGADLFVGINRYLEHRGGGRVFFLGSTEDTLDRIRRRMALDFPRVIVAGTHSPPFTPAFSEAEIAAMVEAVNAAEPDVVWVGMTAPKQEIWLHLARRSLNARFAAGIGAVFDFYTGRVKRSPRAFQRVGLEWLPRLLRQPRRLWRRMLVSAPVFAFHVLTARLRRSLR